MDPSICVTIDYELFGDGSGSIQRDMLQPTLELLSFFNARNIKATFFIEVLELFAMEKAVQVGEGDPSLANDMSAVRDQLKRIVAEGHDIQLHLHPQWHGASWSAEGWILGSKHYGLLQWGEQVLEELVRRGKEYLDEIARPLSSDYECRVFRAGGFHFDRTDLVGEILLGRGIRMDSSTCRGYWRQTPYSSIDYRDLIAYRRAYWRTLDGGINYEDRDLLWEIPIWAKPARQWRKISVGRLRRLFRGDRSKLGLEEISSQTSLRFSPGGILKWMWETQPMLWDFCLLSARQLVESYMAAREFHQVEGFFPLVMIGHTKHLRDLFALAEFHSAVSQNGSVKWISMSEAMNSLSLD